jgi:hypothetical protein
MHRVGLARSAILLSAVNCHCCPALLLAAHPHTRTFCPAAGKEQLVGGCKGGAGEGLGLGVAAMGRWSESQIQRNHQTRPLVFGPNLQCELVRKVDAREECHWSHALQELQASRHMGSNGILECKLLSENVLRSGW